MGHLAHVQTLLTLHYHFMIKWKPGQNYNKCWGGTGRISELYSRDMLYQSQGLYRGHYADHNVVMPSKIPFTGVMLGMAVF